jgi:hypothetical protein
VTFARAWSSGIAIGLALWLLLALTTIATAHHHLPLQPDAPVKEEVFWHRVDEINEWITKHSDYVAFHRPRIIFVPVGLLRTLSAFPFDHTHSTTIGMYLAGHEIIILPMSFKLGEDDPLLLHELVHHAQFRSGRPFVCMDEIEEEAYRLNSKFARENGFAKHYQWSPVLDADCDGKPDTKTTSPKQPVKDGPSPSAE